MGKPGRPQLPDGESKGAILTVRLRGHEIECLRELAEEEGQSVSDYVREVLGFGKKYEAEEQREKEGEE